VLGLLRPDLVATLFAGSGAASAALAALAYLGLLLLMFITGGEMQVRVAVRESRTVASVTVAGLVLPFTVGALVVLALDHRDFSGPAGTPVTFALVFGIAVAVTSIPVISRIMLDLGLLNTPYARIVLSVAAIEDVVLYGVLAVLLALAYGTEGGDFGLWPLLGVESTAWSVVYHSLVTVVFLGASLVWGSRLLHRALHSRRNIVARRSPAAFRLALLLTVVLICTLIDVNPIFGALVTGMCVRRSDMMSEEAGANGAGQPAAAPDPAVAPAPAAAPKSTAALKSTAAPEPTAAVEPIGPPRAWESIRQFSLAFFIPIYFVTVGLKLDLRRDFDPVFFCWFLLLCCVVKTVSVWLGARLAGEPHSRATDLAIGLNARGGPGIVLATVTLDAGVINAAFFTSIVLLSVVTSQLAGFWLDRRLPALTGRPAADARQGSEPATLEVR
jgi:Kef-type K+ transport system membrane component KefB